MKSFIPFFFFLFGVILLQAQQPNTTIALEINMQQLAKLGVSTTAHAIGFDNRYEGVRGSPMIYDEWQTGMIQVSDVSTVPSGVKMNIDGADNQVHVQMKTGVIALENDKFQYVLIETPLGTVKYQVFEKSEILGDGKTDGKMLVEVLFDNEKYGLLKDPKVIFKKANYQGAYSADVRYDEFVHSPVYFLRKGTRYEKIKLRKKTIQKIIPEIRQTEGWDGTELTEQKLVHVLAMLSNSDKRFKNEN